MENKYQNSMTSKEQTTIKPAESVIEVRAMLEMTDKGNAKNTIGNGLLIFHVCSPFLRFWV